MKDSMGTRILLSILLIIFMYAAAACSKSEKRSLKDDSEEINTAVENATKTAIADEANVFIRLAEEQYVEDSITDGTEKSCYFIKDLYNGNTYEGVIVKNAQGEWTIYFTNGTYKVNGKAGRITSSDVEEGNKIAKTSCIE